MKILLHSSILLLSFGLIFGWEQSSLNTYTVQLLALMVLAYLITQFVRRKMKKSDAHTSGFPEVFALNTAIFLLIYATGQMASWFFFLLYFLGFGITFIFEPATVFVFALGTVGIFLPEVLKNGGSIGTYIQLGSFILISPLPYFFGKEYQDRQQQDEQIQELTERSNEAGTTIAQDVSDVMHNEKKNLKSEDIEKLNEILEETQDLRSETPEK
jgi:membrane protein implicated in regulation of membrane protease activity